MIINVGECMFSIGDLVIYSTHGVCKIDDICQKTVAGVTREYYELHPLGNEQETQLTISTPVHNNEVTMLELMDEDEADDVLESFKNPVMKQYEDVSKRHNAFAKLVDSGDRQELANVTNTLMRKKMEMLQDNKKLNQRDQDLLNAAQDTLFEELAISLDTNSKQINKTVVGMIKTEDVS